MHHLSDRIAHTRTCYTSSGALAGTRNSLWSTVRDRSDDPSHHERTLYDRNNVLPVSPPPHHTEPLYSCHGNLFCIKLTGFCWCAL